MRPHNLFGILAILGITLMLSGCTTPLFSGPTTYTAHPVQVQYTLRYGYFVNCTGTGAYEVTYTCDLPEVLIGDCPFTLINASSQVQDERADNTVIVWNITGSRPHHYLIGVQTQVEAQTYLFSDLTGKRALSLAQLRVTAQDFVDRYTNVQGNNSTRYIDPADPAISAVADTVLRNSSTNSFLLAKALFKWLKENCHYQTHESVGVQPAAQTLVLKTGDCDDLSFLYISLCRSVGIPARFIRGYLLSDTTPMQAVAHAWVEVFIGPGVGVGGWIPVECSCVAPTVQTDIEQNFGVEDCYHLRVFQDTGDNASIDAILSSITYLTHGPVQAVEPPVPFVVLEDFSVVSSKQLVIQTDGTRSLQ